MKVAPERENPQRLRRADRHLEGARGRRPMAWVMREQITNEISVKTPGSIVSRRDSIAGNATEGMPS
jgi:hypothetical protein